MFNNTQLAGEVGGLKGFALRLTSSHHDADDLIQATLLRALEKKHLFQENSNLFRWTSKIMYNIFASGYRRKVKFESKSDPEDYIEKLFVNASQDTYMELKDVRQAMAQMQDEHREVLILVCVQGMCYQEVSDELAIPVGTVRSRLSRARRQLHILLDSPTVFQKPVLKNKELERDLFLQAA